MKTKITVAALTLLIAVNLSFGEKPPKRTNSTERHIESAVKNLMAGLHSDNSGVVEASIKLGSMICIYAPEKNFTELHNRLNELSISHFSEAIRYKAYIASNICSNPKWFDQLRTVSSDDDESFFLVAADNLQQILFGVNSL